MKVNELDDVVLTTDLPEHNLKRGDVGTVVLIHDDGMGYEVEFITLGGETLAVVALEADQVRPIKAGEIAHVRSVDAVSA